MEDDTEMRQRIEVRAYQLWVESGQPEGRAEDFWQMAKAQIENENREGPAAKPRPN